MSEITLGIIGGGQLGSMLAISAKKLNIKTVIYCDDPHAPAQNFCDKFISGGYNDKEKIIEFKPEIVIHLASYLSASDQFVDILKLIDANLLFLSKLLNAVSEIHLDLFINTGSFSEYRNGDEELIPAYFYAATKTASRSIVDYYSNNYGFKQTTIIPYTIYGGNDSQKKL